MDRGPTFRTAGETAALLGISAKALRVCERHGLIEPSRTAAGYRVYGPAEMRRLHQVLALKSLGLSLAQIGKCLAGLGDNLGPILEAQERELLSRIATLRTAVAAVAAARSRLKAGGCLSVDDLVTLTKEIVMTEGKPDWRQHLTALFAPHFTDAQREKIVGLPMGKPETDADIQEREMLLAEAKALVGTDPGSLAAMELARRWRDRAIRFTGGNQAMLLKLRTVLEEALANPEISATLPWRDELSFIKAATEKLEAAGG